jgi:translation elongation factor EF-4
VRRAVLLIDATKGVQAQAVNLRLAKNLKLKIILLLIRSTPLADVPAASRQIKQLLGIEEEPLHISAKTGEVSELLQKLSLTFQRHVLRDSVLNLAQLQALVFNSTYDPHLGVIACQSCFWSTNHQ